jgi:hypothetical protein
MKKVLLIMALLSLIAGGKCSGGRNGGNAEGEPADTLTSTPSATDLIVMVYSNAYDGFLNVREQPDVKSPIIGKILNGPMGAVKMGEVGGWTIVKVGETIGYASSRYLQTEPTAEFTDKDMEKCLMGEWIRDSKMDQRVLVLMKNGLVAEGYTLEGWLSCGTWKVKGNVLELSFTKVFSMEKKGWENGASTENWNIENGDLIIDGMSDKYKKQRLMSAKDYDALEEPEWYVLSQDAMDYLYEQTHLQVKGTYPGGK